MEMRDELKSKLKKVGNVIPKMSEAILNLRNEVSEGKKGAMYKCWPDIAPSAVAFLWRQRYID